MVLLTKPKSEQQKHQQPHSDFHPVPVGTIGLRQKVNEKPSEKVEFDTLEKTGL